MRTTHTASSILRRMIRRQRGKVAFGAFFLGMWQLSEALVPVAIGLIVDHAVLTKDLRRLVVGLVAFVVLFVVLSFSYRFGSRALNRAVNFESHALRVEVADHALKNLDPRNLVPGEVMSRSTADADSSTRIFGQIGTGVSAATGFLGAATYLLISDWLVGLLVLVLVPIISGVVALASKGISKRSVTQQEKLAESGAQASDIMMGLRVIKAIGGERWAVKTFEKASQASARAAVDTAVASGKVAGIGELSIAVNLAAVLLLAGWRVTTGELGPGQLIAIVGVAVYLSEPIRLLSNSINASAIAHGAAKRVANFLNLDESQAQYESSETINDGEFLVIVPPASTLPHGDNILATPHAADIFEGTLRSNISMNHEDNVPIDPQVIRASGLTDIIEVDGLDAPVRDTGSNLSGGQRQRVALARALHADAEVLVLMDPTSAVDSVTEVSIAQGIKQLRAGKTTIVVSSSPAFYNLADRVISHV